MSYTGGTTSGLSLKKRLGQAGRCIWRRPSRMLHPPHHALEIVMATTRLYFTASVEEQWRSLVGPWLREQAQASWRSPKPTVILTPSRAESFYLRSRLVGEGVSFLGLRFWTPSDARKFLLAELPTEIDAATQAELRLVARACAEKLLRKSVAINPTLTSVIRDPGAFLRAYDLLLGAGWDPSHEGAIYGRELAREMQLALEKYQIATQAGLHQRLRIKAASQSEQVIANLLVVGFNATHWPLWDLLKALVYSAEQSVVALSEPRVFAEEIDQLWISSWEEVAGTEAVFPSEMSESGLDDETQAPFAALVASYEKGETGLRPSDLNSAELSFCVTPDLESHTRGVVLQALDYLKSASCTRLGIVFPEADALALGVVEELRRLGISVDDGTGSLAPGLFEGRCWQSWIALQEEPGVRTLIAWIRACEAEGMSFGMEAPLSARLVAEILESALGDSLVDNLEFLARHLEENSNSNQAGAVADFLHRRLTLPEEASYSEFLELTRQAIGLPGWENHLARLQVDPPAWLKNLNSSLSRRAFLEWLKESTNSQARIRGANGNHFYGKVHLIIYGQMSGQSWSHLILTGLNEGVWPRVFEAGAFGSRHELAALNQQARGLNRLGTSQGRQGMGQEIVAADRGHCLLPLDRQDLALRDLCAALEATHSAACLTAMTTEGGRSLLPSDFFNHAYQAATGRVLDDETFRRLASFTEAWCKRQILEQDGKARAESEIIATTQIAYTARRDSALPFGPFEFAYVRAPRKPIQLSCKRWEDAWNHPATVWLEDIVGASPWPEGALSWSRAVGTWAHRWMATALRECQERNSTAQLQAQLWAAADRDARAMQNRARDAGVELYPWWRHVWGRSRTLALGLAETLEPHLRDRQFLCELKLPHDLMIALPGMTQADFALKGRIDLLLIGPGKTVNDPADSDFSGCLCWVIDFKTGSAQSLTGKKIEEGKGLQPVLYALAVRARGAVSTAISLHTAHAPLKQQVQLDEALGFGPLFQSLDKFHRDGVFGMRPDADNPYGFSPSYPMATRFIPSSILAAKWALVHGAVPTVGEESE